MRKKRRKSYEKEKERAPSAILSCFGHWLIPCASRLGADLWRVVVGAPLLRESTEPTAGQTRRVPPGRDAYHADAAHGCPRSLTAPAEGLPASPASRDFSCLIIVSACVCFWQCPLSTTIAQCFLRTPSGSSSVRWHQSLLRNQRQPGVAGGLVV
jgi:hypothetical protein